MIPALAVGIILESAFSERYLEVPLVAIGSAWMLLGVETAKDRTRCLLPQDVAQDWVAMAGA